jgi:hypothetical protein
MQLVVLGMHRSGTSLLTNILVKMGCYPGPEVGPADRWNAGGYWEHPGVLALDMDLFKALGARWYDVGQIDPDRLEAAERRGLEDRAVEILRELDGHRPWVIKDPRLCVLFTFWRPLLQRPIALLIHRDPVSIARSLRARDGLPLLFGIALWEHHVRAALAATVGLPRILVSHRELTADPSKAVVRLHRQLVALGVEGLPDPVASELEALFRPALNHYQPDPSSHNEYLNAGQLELLESLESAQVSAEESRSCSRGGQDLIQVYARHQSEWDSLKEQIYVLSAAQGRLTSELQALGAARDALQREDESLASRHRDLSSELAALGAARDALHAENEQMAHERQLLAQQTDSLGGRVQALLAEREVLARQNRDLTGEFAAMAAERRDLRTMLETWQQRMAFVESTRAWRTRERALRVRRYLERLAGRGVDPRSEPAKRVKGS